jgi:hypothetical protein
VANVLPQQVDGLVSQRWQWHGMYFVIGFSQHKLTSKRKWVMFLSIYGSAALVDLGRSFSFLIYTQSVGLLGRGSSHRKAAIYTQNKRTQTSMPWVRFEPTIPVFEQAKRVDALDRSVTAVGKGGIFLEAGMYVCIVLIRSSYVGLLLSHWRSWYQHVYATELCPLSCSPWKSLHCWLHAASKLTIRLNSAAFSLPWRPRFILLMFASSHVRDVHCISGSYEKRREAWNLDEREKCACCPVTRFLHRSEFSQHGTALHPL